MKLASVRNGLNPHADTRYNRNKVRHFYCIFIFDTIPINMFVKFPYKPSETFIHVYNLRCYVTRLLRQSDTVASRLSDVMTLISPDNNKQQQQQQSVGGYLSFEAGFRVGSQVRILSRFSSQDFESGYRVGSQVRISSRISSQDFESDLKLGFRVGFRVKISSRISNQDFESGF